MTIQVSWYVQTTNLSGKYAQRLRKHREKGYQCMGVAYLFSKSLLHTYCVLGPVLSFWGWCNCWMARALGYSWRHPEDYRTLLDEFFWKINTKETDDSKYVSL